MEYHQLPRVREKGQRLKISKIKKLLRSGCISQRTQEETSPIASHSRSVQSSQSSHLHSHSHSENSTHQSHLSSHSHPLKSSHQFQLSSHSQSVQPSQSHLSLSLLQITQRPLLEEPLLSGYKIGVDESLSAGAGLSDEKWRCDVSAKTDVIPEDQALDSLPPDQAMQLIDPKEDSLEDWPSYMPWSKGVEVFGLMFGPLAGLCCCLGRNKTCLRER